MLNLPEFGAVTKVWPMPGRRVLSAPFHPDASPLAQVPAMPTSGQTVKWDPYWLGQLREGAIIMHAPPCEEHDHGDDGVDVCTRCGRSLRDAQVYDVHYAHGLEKAREVAAAADKALAAALSADGVKAEEDRRAKRVAALKSEAAKHAEGAKAALTAILPGELLKKK